MEIMDNRGQAAVDPFPLSTAVIVVLAILWFDAWETNTYSIELFAITAVVLGGLFGLGYLFREKWGTVWM